MSRVAKVIAWAELRGRDDGLKGASSAWLAVWVLTTGWKYVKRMTQPDPVVIRERLEPGQQLVVTHFAPGAETAGEDVPARRGRRRRRRS